MSSAHAINSYTVYLLTARLFVKPTPGALISANGHNQRLTTVR